MSVGVVLDADGRTSAIVEVLEVDGRMSKQAAVLDADGSTSAIMEELEVDGRMSAVVDDDCC
jgi:hypothetical protein